MKYIIFILLLTIALFGVHGKAEAQLGNTNSPPQANKTITKPLSPPEEFLLDVFFYGDVLYGDENKSSLNKLDVNAFPEEIRARVAEFKYRYLNFKSMLKEPEYNSDVQSNFMAEIWFDKKVSFEHTLVSLINTPGIETIAADIAADTDFYYEWEGFSEGPLSEGAWARNYLGNNPGTPLEPYMILFVIHRNHYAISALKSELNSPPFDDYPTELAKGWLQETETSYAHFMQRAAEHPDPLVGWMAKAIARLRD